VGSSANAALARLLRAGLIRRGAAGLESQTPAPAPENVRALAQRDAHEPPLEQLVPGRWETLGEQRCYVTDQTYPWAHTYGQAPLASMLEIPDAEWLPFAQCDPTQSFALQRAVFLDIETTGLARGAGTYAFLIGIGLPGEAGLRVRQFFMPNYGDEEALLNLLSADLQGSDGLVTFNGRSFDWPILRTRYIMARQAPPLSEDAPHLDLLPLARRLWRRRLSSCALSSLEISVLGMQRQDDDVPGWMIPQLYQDYVELGRTRPLVGVFYHNAMDIVALGALAGRIGRLLCDPQHDEAADCCDYVALGMLYERNERPDEALAAYQSAIEATPDPREAFAACRCQAALLKRLGRLDDACRVWQAQTAGDDIYPYIELAKYHEHRQRDYWSARQWVLAARAWLDEREPLLDPPQAENLRAALDHRLERLERRIANAHAAGLRAPRSGRAGLPNCHRQEV